MFFQDSHFFGHRLRRRQAFHLSKEPGTTKRSTTDHDSIYAIAVKTLLGTLRRRHVPISYDRYMNPRIHIPIIGNGDVTTPERAKECFDRYGVDAIMIGRATFGCPWLFAEMKGLPSPQTMAEKVAVLKEHVLAAIQWCGGDERKGIVHSRRHFAASPVFKGLADFRQTRIALLRAETTQEVFAIMDDIVAKWGNE